MKFNAVKYTEDKEKVIQLIKNTHKWETIEGFIADGVINPSIYEKQKIKVLVFLAESYGYSESKVVDIEGQPDEDILGIGHHNRQTPRKISTLLWLLFESIDKERELSWEEFPSLLGNSDSNYEMLQDTLSRIAYVNVKKASRHIERFGNDATRQDYSEIYDSCFRNFEILKLQIDSISPDLIIVCSDPVYDGLYENDLLGEQVLESAKNIVQTNELGQKIIHLSHPSYYRDWGYEKIYETYQLIFKSLT